MLQVNLLLKTVDDEDTNYCFVIEGTEPVVQAEWLALCHGFTIKFVDKIVEIYDKSKWFDVDGSICLRLGAAELTVEEFKNKQEEYRNALKAKAYQQMVQQSGLITPGVARGA